MLRACANDGGASARDDSELRSQGKSCHLTQPRDFVTAACSAPAQLSTGRLLCMLILERQRPHIIRKLKAMYLCTSLLRRPSGPRCGGTPCCPDIRQRRSMDSSGREPLSQLNRDHPRPATPPCELTDEALKPATTQHRHGGVTFAKDASVGPLGIAHGSHCAVLKRHSGLTFIAD